MQANQMAILGVEDALILNIVKQIFSWVTKRTINIIML